MECTSVPLDGYGNKWSISDVYEYHLNDSSNRSDTKFALGESVKVFGRMACKFPYLLALNSFEIPSICTEFLSGVAGMFVGGVVGATAILARKCMGAEARKFFELEKPKSLMDYSITGFYKGARLGELPGKIVGGCSAFVFGASFFLSSSVMVPAVLGISGIVATVAAVTSYVSIKCHGDDGPSDFSRNWIQCERAKQEHVHKVLQGFD